MAYITQQYVEDMIGADKALDLVPTAAEMSRAIAYATTQVEMALQSAGYTTAVPATVYASDASDCPDSISALAFAAWAKHAYSRNDIGDVPGDVWAAWKQVDDLRNGTLELPGMTRSTSRSVGGFSSTSTTASPRIFRDLRTR